MPRIDGNTPDEDLLPLLIAGDPRVQAIVFERHRGAVSNRARRVLGNDTHAIENVVVDTFVEGLKRENLQTFRGTTTGTRYSTWLCTIAKNKAVDALRQRIRERERLEKLMRYAETMPRRHVAPSPIDLEIDEARLRLLSAIDRLSPRRRTALELRYFGGLSFEEMAQAMNIRADRCRTLVSEAYAEIRDSLLKDPDDEA